MTKNSAEKRAARAYLAENPSLTYHQALQHIRKVHEENNTHERSDLHLSPHTQAEAEL